jgi:hypothetical protein
VKQTRKQSIFITLLGTTKQKSRFLLKIKASTKKKIPRNLVGIKKKNHYFEEKVFVKTFIAQPF